MATITSKSIGKPAGSGFNTYPLSSFSNCEYEAIPTQNWLRLCPFNETTKRWHIPMKANERTQAVYWTIYRWFRGNEWDCNLVINSALSEQRGLFCDTAYADNHKDFWLVADKDLVIDRKLLGDPEKIGIPVSKSMNRDSSPNDLLLPDWRNKFTTDWQGNFKKEPWDEELENASRLAHKALESLEAKTRFMKRGKH